MFAVRLGCFCLDLNLRMHMSFVLQFQFMKYEKIHTLMWPGMSASISQVKKYTFQFIYRHVPFVLWTSGQRHLKKRFMVISIHCAYWTKEKLSYKEFIFYAYLHYKNSIPKWNRELTSNCNRLMIIKSLCTSTWKTCHCFPTENYWSIRFVSGQC